MSPRKPQSKFRNRLLAALAKDDLALLELPQAPTVLERGKTLESANRKIEAVYFPEHGVVSVVGGAGANGREVEVGIIGREGVTGLPVILGDHRSPNQTFVQIPGDGYRVSVAALRSALGSSPILHRLLLKYVQAFMIQTAHTAIANGRGTLEQRLARWILMAQDRSDGKELPLTHEFLSLMLAVRRPGVTETLHRLADQGLIRHDRGVVTVLDREGLLEAANGLYGVPESEYERLFA
jgi:CRP-like cAMP-binding protein